MSVSSSDPQLGWIPAIPEPFWYKSWRTLFRWKPQCVECGSMISQHRMSGADIRNE